MKKLYFFVVGIFSLMNAMAQQEFTGKMETMKGQPTVCPADFHDVNTYVPPPQAYLDYVAGKKARTTAKSTFIVEYIGFTSPAAQRAFQAAVDIWSSLIDSPVPIRVEARWVRMDDASVLGSANSADFMRNFPGSQVASTWYPIAIAERLARRDLNSPNSPDIVAQFNSKVNWYYGQGTPGVNQFDLTTIVLHELCHGLGFTSSMRVSGTNGSWGLGTSSPFIYDRFIENATAQKLIDTLSFKNPSQALRSQLVSNNLVFNGNTAILKNGGVKPKLYAPTDYQGGSSISHLDDATYPAGNINSLMTSTASIREINRDPGPIVMGIFADMGWKGSSLIHYKQDSLETAKEVVIKAEIVGDTTLAPNTFKVYYTENDPNISNAKAIDMTRVVTTDTYTATIPITATKAQIRYYIIAEDIAKRKLTSPPEAPKYYYRFSVGNTDITPPQIEHTAPLIIPSDLAKQFPILANVQDDFAHGVESVKLEYSINGVDKPTVDIKKYTTADDPKLTFSQGRADDVAYLLKDVFKDLKNGDRVKYRIVATDNAKAKNKRTLPSYYTGVGKNLPPTPDFFEFVVADAKLPAVKTYKNDFNTSTTDFATVGFSVAQPSGFDNGGLHSIHPYKNGGDVDFNTSWAAQLMVPIVIKDTATIAFDEVVLVEPGETGYPFGHEYFYDYVVVEGSPDKGITWVPFEDGYDSRDDKTWLNTFNGTAVDGPNDSQNSGGVGTKAMFRSRSINMLANEYFDFAVGDTVMVRFRLLADAFTNGWGWAIDNLQIQVPPPPPITSVIQEENTELLAISPNPTAEFVQVKTSLPKAGELKMEVVGVKGNKILEKNFTATDKYFNHQLDIQDLSAGTYFIRLSTKETQITKRFVVEK